jgi:hypothetical protein
VNDITKKKSHFCQTELRLVENRDDRRARRLTSASRRVEIPVRVVSIGAVLVDCDLEVSVLPYCGDMSLSELGSYRQKCGAF